MNVAFSTSQVAAGSPAVAGERSRAAEALNRSLSKAWARGAMPVPTLDEEALLAWARKRTGLNDFGPEMEWRPQLGVLLRALTGEAELNPIGRTMANGQVVGLLQQRLLAQALFDRHPEIRQRPIAAPIIVIGHMRSGTTRAQRLLACDPRLVHTRGFETLDPVPRRPDLRRWKARAMLATLRSLNPEQFVIHPMSAGAPEEEFGLLNHGFYGAALEAQWRVPSFARWWAGRDRTPVYHRFADLLRLIGWGRGDDPAEPWLLKVPQFTEDIEPLLRVFPDARLLFLHRDPAAVVASSCSLVLNATRLQSDRADPRTIGREWLAKVAARERAMRDARARRPDVTKLDLRFDEVSRDWREAMRRTYDWLGMPLTPEVEEHMARYLRRAERSGYRGHRYRLEDFGLTVDQVREAVPA